MFLDIAPEVLTLENLKYIFLLHTLIYLSRSICKKNIPYGGYELEEEFLLTVSLFSYPIGNLRKYYMASYKSKISSQVAFPACPQF